MGTVGAFSIPFALSFGVVRVNVISIGVTCVGVRYLGVPIN